MVVAFTGQNLLVKPMMMATRVHEKGVLAKALTPKSLCDGLRYALLQGGLFSCGRQENKELPLEPKLNNSKGAVSLITGTSEFFFSLEDHPEWNGSFSVWGKVVGARSWRVLERLVALPTRQEIHPSGTTLRILLKPVVFKARIGTNIQPTLVMD
jgi:hypothetical protein